MNRNGSVVIKLMCLAAAVSLLAGSAIIISGCWKKDKKPNVVLIIIDTLPAKHSDVYGYERSTTPFVGRLAQDGIVYETAVAPAPWTLPSIASILTGMLPSRHMAGWHLDPPEMEDRRLSRIKPEVVTMAEIFRDHGYQTAGVFNNPFVDPGYGLNKGFDSYDYFGGDNLSIRTAAQVTDDAIAWIELHKDKPFFLVVHYFDPHLAYNPALDYALPYMVGYEGELKPPFNPNLAAVRAGLETYSDEDWKYVIGLYDGEIAYTDAEMGRLLIHLKKIGQYDPNLIVATSDHGEEFWEHGGFEHGHSLHQEVIEVPLVIKYPENEHAGSRVSGCVSLVDLFPTIMEMMNWPLSFSTDGVSLYPRAGQLKVRPHQVVSENIHYGPQKQCLYSEGFKLIVERGTGKTEIYDLEKDPEEKKNVFGEVELPPSIKEQIENIAKDLEAALKEEKPEAANLDRETIEKLKSLGYISF